MITDNNTGLVLEGGGMRGVFTCGVLDCFMDYGIRFPFAVGFRYLLTQGCIMDFKLLFEDFPERPIEVSRMAMTLP